MAQGPTSSHPPPPGGSGDSFRPREPVSAWIRSHGQGFQIGPWKVWPDRGELADGATSCHLEPKEMEVLVYLALEAGKVVSHEKILEAVWPETFIQDSVLFRHVSALRRILGDDVHAPRFIETIPKRGYRLIAAVSRLDRRCGSEPSAAPASTYEEPGKDPPASTYEEPGKDLRPVWLTAVLAVLALCVLAMKGGPRLPRKRLRQRRRADRGPGPGRRPPGRRAGPKPGVPGPAADGPPG